MRTWPWVISAQQRPCGAKGRAGYIVTVEKDHVNHNRERSAILFVTRSKYMYRSHIRARGVKRLIAVIIISNATNLESQCVVVAIVTLLRGCTIDININVLEYT